MSTAFLEQLQSRLMFHNTGPLKPTEPTDDEPASVVVRYTTKGDTNTGSTVNFADLVSLAQNYNQSSRAWEPGDFNHGSVNFADLVSLAQNYNQVAPGSGLDPFAADWALALSQPSATVTSKGKLVVSMGTFDNANLSITNKGATRVFFNRRSGAADVFLRSFKGVKSIELRGSSRADTITLGDGIRFTTVHAGNGDDTIRGGSGDSILFGADGKDRIYGGGGDDSLHGEEGDDRLYGESGNDMLDGAIGRDRLDGGKGRNRLLGRSGADYLSMRVGRDKTDSDKKDRVYRIE